MAGSRTLIKPVRSLISVVRAYLCKDMRDQTDDSFYGKGLALGQHTNRSSLSVCVCFNVVVRPRKRLTYYLPFITSTTAQTAAAKQQQ